MDREATPIPAAVNLNALLTNDTSSCCSESTENGQGAQRPANLATITLSRQTGTLIRGSAATAAQGGAIGCLCIVLFLSQAPLAAVSADGCVWRTLSAGCHISRGGVGWLAPVAPYTYLQVPFNPVDRRSQTRYAIHIALPFEKPEFDGVAPRGSHIGEQSWCQGG